MIKKLFKKKTSYDLIESRNIVMWWVKDCIDELLKKEMGSDMQVK